jgi:glucose/arabinose dehydrogenase
MTYTASVPVLLRVLVLLVGSLLLAACSSTPATQPPTAAPALTLPDGFRAEVYAQGLNRPTALAAGPDGALYLTQLNGSENAGVGQVVRIAQPGAAPQPVLDGLTKPTGLAWRDDTLWLVAGRDVLRAALHADGTLSAPETVLRDLPFNGRSNGQITLLPDGRLLFAASGSLRDPESGVLLTLDPDTETQPQVLATGLKNAYAHAIDPATGTLYTTEIGDNPVNGQPPPDEINRVQPGADYGWPPCYGNQQPARNYDGTEEQCATTEPPVVVLPPRSTPTGLAWYAGKDFPAPYQDRLYVALWNGDPPRVATVRLDAAGAQIAGTTEPFISGVERPIALLPDPRGGLLVVDDTAGIVYRVLAAPEE